MGGSILLEDEDRVNNLLRQNNFLLYD